MIRSNVARSAAFIAVMVSAVDVRAGDQDVARVHFEAGKRFYDVAEYEPALKEFRAAYLAKPDAVFLYNIAQCHRQLHHGTEAVAFYRRYLSVSPDASNRREVEARIAELTVPSAPPPPMPAAPLPPAPVTQAPAAAPVPLYRRWWFWTALGVVAAGATVAVVATSNDKGDACLGISPCGTLR